MVVRINRHSVVMDAPGDWVPSQHYVTCGINFSNFIRISQIHINLLSCGIVLGHARLALEFECLHDFVFVHIHNGDGFAERVGNIQLVKRRGVCAAVGLGGGCQPFEDGHGSQVHEADFLFAPIRCVDLAKSWYIFKPQSGAG